MTRGGIAFALLPALLFCVPAAQGQDNWQQLSPPASPPAREASWMTYDAARQQIVLFGGNGETTTYLADTWVWDGSTWTQKAPMTSPPGRYRHCMAYDTVNQVVIMFGGQGSTGSLTDTWTWDGNNWTLNNSSGPSGSCNYSFAYDQLHQQAIYFGENSDPNSIVGQTWSWNGTTWTLLAPTTNPPSIGSSLLVYDEARQQLVLATYTDNPSDNEFVSTWVWDGSNWNRKTDIGTLLPYFPIVNPSQAVYDALRQQVVVFLQRGPAQTWTWNGTSWLQLSPANSPSTRILPAMEYDPRQEQVVLFGGGINNAPFVGSDTWTFGPTLPAVNVTVPAGVQFTFNGVTYTGSQSIPIAAGTYTLSTNSPQSTGVGAQALFQSWSDAGAQSHMVTVSTSNVNITGTFQTQYFLSTVASPSIGGTVSPGAYYNAGTPVTVSATPAANYSFTGWTGACTGTGACIVTMNGPATVTANFVLQTTSVTFNVPPGIQFSIGGFPFTGSRTLSLSPGSYTLAVASPQSTGVGTLAVFQSWSDGGAQSHSLIVGATPITVTGTFKTQYQLTTVASPAGAGGIAQTGSSSSGPFYDAGTAVVIQATPSLGYSFQFFSGACSGSSAFCLVVMNAPQTVIANFTVPLDWVRWFPPTSPSPRAEGSMVWDAAHSNMVLFGGFASDDLLNETWTWDGGNWSLRAPQNSPSGRVASAMAFDSRNEQVVMFAGLDTFVNLLRDTWVWDGSNWIQKAPSNQPTSRWGAQMVFDQENNAVVLFGGALDDPGPSGTWLWDGTNWTLATPLNSPSDRNFHAMAYDPARHRVVLFGGSALSGTLGDTWEWDGSNWTLQTPAHQPPARDGATLAFDGRIQQIVLFGGRDVNANALNDTWVWNGTDWSQVMPVASPPARAFAAMDYDPIHQELLLFGGGLTVSVPNNFFADTWIYLPPSVNVVSQGFSTVKDGSGNFLLTVTLLNAGNIPLTDILISGAKLGNTAAIAFTTPQLVAGVAPGATVSFTAKFPPTAVSGLTSSAVSFSGSYSAGPTIGAAWTASVRNSPLP